MDIFQKMKEKMWTRKRKWVKSERETSENMNKQTNEKKIKIIKWYMIATTTFKQCVNIYLLYKKIKSFDVKGLALSSYQLTKFLPIFVFVGVVIFEN